MVNADLLRREGVERESKPEAFLHGRSILPLLPAFIILWWRYSSRLETRLTVAAFRSDPRQLSLDAEIPRLRQLALQRK